MQHHDSNAVLIAIIFIYYLLFHFYSRAFAKQMQTFIFFRIQLPLTEFIQIAG